VEGVDYEKAFLLGWRFKLAVNEAVKMLKQGLDEESVLRKIYEFLPNYVYAGSCLKQAKAIAEGLVFHKASSAFANKPFIFSRGNKFDNGNGNIKLVSVDRVKIKYLDGSWIEGRVSFDEKYNALLKELIELANKEMEGYAARIVLEIS